MIRLIEIPDVFQPRGRLVREVPDAATVAELLQRDLGPGPWHTIRHGRPVAPEQTLQPGDELVAVRRPAGGIFASILFAVVSAAVSVGISFLVNLLLGGQKQPQQGEGGPDGSATYNWGGIQNSRVSGTVEPAIYGEHRVGGQIIALHRRNERPASGNLTLSTRTNLYMVRCLGYGPIKAIGQYEKDMDHLASRDLIEDDFNRADSDLSADERWTLRAGSNAAFQVQSNKLFCFGTGSSGEIILSEGVGTAKNVALELRMTGLPGGQPNSARFCINFLDGNNYDAFYYDDDAGLLRVIERRGGVDTIKLSTTVIAESLVRLERHTDCISLYVGGALAGSYDSGNLSTGAVGVHQQVTGTIQSVDDLRAEAAQPLPDGQRFNGVDANSFDDTLCFIRLGHFKQDLLPDPFSKIIQAYQPAVTLDRKWTEYVLHRAVEGFQLVLEFPSGLYDQSGGALSDATVTVEVELSEDGGASWTPITGSPFALTAQLIHSFTATIFQESPPLTGSGQRLRIRRTTEEAEDDALLADRVVLADVNEIERDDVQSYDDHAIVANVIGSSDQLSGLPTITDLVKGLMVPRLEPSSDPQEPRLLYGYGDNPADVALDLLMNKDRGLGNFVGVQGVDFVALDAWRSWCAEQLTYSDWRDEPLASTDATAPITAGSRTVHVTDPSETGKFDELNYCTIQDEGLNVILAKEVLGDGTARYTLYTPALLSYPAGWILAKIGLLPETTEARHGFNGVFDGQVSSWEALLRICRAGRAMPAKFGRRISFRAEREAEPVQLISESSMIEGSLEIDYIGSAERKDRLEVQYLDRDQDYAQEMVPAGGFPPASLARAPVVDAIELYGIVSRSHARREGFYHLNAQRVIRRRVRFRLALDGIACEAGDVVSLALNLPAWTHWVGRASGTLQAFRVAHRVVLASGVTYQAMIRTAVDRAPASVTVTSPAGTYEAGDELSTDSSAADVIEDAPVAIGTRGSITRDYRITTMSIEEDLTVGVEAVEYRPEVYALIEPPPQFCVLPEAGGEVEPGCTYFIPWGPDGPAECDCETGCQANCGGTCCTTREVTVDVTGAAADCVEIDVDETGITFTILPGCEGLSFCLGIEGTKTDICNTDPNCTCEQVVEQIPPCDKFQPIFQCEFACSRCYTISP